MFQISQVLKRVPFFEALDKEGIDFIVERLKFKPFDQNEVICRIGDPGDRMYIIISGQVKVVVDNEEGEETIIAHLGSGDYFGEMALLTGEPRSATIVTTEPSEMFMLNKSDFDEILAKYPSISISMGKIMSHRLRETLQKAARKEKAATKPALRGSLSVHPLENLLKFCESNSLNGKLLLRQNEREGVLVFQKGVLQSVSLGDLKDDQAMDEMLEWKEGEFSIVPEPLKLEEAPEETAPQSKQILVISNSLVVQKALQAKLEAAGHSVYTVDNLQKGIHLIVKLQPDLVITDTMLPDARGSEIARQIREKSELPILFLTDEKGKEKWSQEVQDFASVRFTESRDPEVILQQI